MGNLATYLQQQFQAHCPPDWQANREAQVLSDELRQLMGYAPQVDILLTHKNGRLIRRGYQEEILARLNQIEGISLPPEAMLCQPTVTLTDFLDEEHLADLLSVIEWMIEIIKAH